ncbi:High-affinity glucose transporter [Colletotrichum viniferum]|nr:High-affinity glucose transporter [Colletotrichum viniferum]
MGGPKALRGHHGNTKHALLASIGISMGGLLYGLDTGIIATTISQSTFKTYMYGGSQGPPALVGGIVALYYAGGCIGGLQSGWLMDKWSRRYTVLIGAVVSILGAALQAAAVNPGMMIAGRIFSGWSTGVLYSVTPIYLAEISPPENRGFLVELKGLTNAGGFFVANWIGYAGSFASGNGQWRIPLAMQAPPAVGLGLLVFAMPFSPRWLVKQERHEDAVKVLRRLHGARGEDFVQHQYVEIRDQLALEADLCRQSSLKILFTRQYARRMLLACLIVNMTKLSGSQVIIKKREHVAHYHMHEQHMNTQATRICLTILDKFDTSAALEAEDLHMEAYEYPFVRQMENKFPWACYAAEYWSDHLRENREIPPEAVSAMLRSHPLRFEALFFVRRRI